MLSKKLQVERRKHKRFRVQDGAFVMLRPSHSHMGRIVDISMSGLAFECFGEEEPATRPKELEIFVTDSSFRLNMPCQLVYGLPTYESPLTSYKKKRCGVQFGDLTEYQTSLLADFIEHHTLGEV
ncbi:MAG: PilZ domain-containing protein [Desulfobacterales bacterium]|nr:MAG: PilZ domain-containing protein [Desulfobacterales bacterium]